MNKPTTNPILIVPIDDGSKYINFNKFPSYYNNNPYYATFIINEEIYSRSDINQFYNHIGKYVISASSYSDKNSKPEYAFNSKGKGWKSNSAINSNSQTITVVKKNSDNTYSSTGPQTSNYSQLHFGPSYFNNLKNNPDKHITTNVKGNTISQQIQGEWLQIQLPEPIYLFKYTIKVPGPTLTKNDDLTDFLSDYNITNIPYVANYSKYYSKDMISDHYISHIPKVFTVVGSKDGSDWYYVDHQSFVTPPDLSYSYMKFKTNPNLFNGYTVVNDGSNSQITFQVNSVEHYTYFRIIVTEMFPGKNFVEIDELDIYAFVDIITPNKDSLKKSYYNDISLNSKGSIESFQSQTNSLEYLTGMQANWDFLTNNIDNGLMNLYREQMTNINDAKKNQPLPNLEGFNISKIENFDSHGYVSYKGNVSGNLIYSNQILPLNYIHTDFINLQRKVNSNYFDISQNLYDFSNNYYNALKDPDDKYNMNTNGFNKPPTRTDGWINDNKEMVLQQNTIYLLSTITIATLVIGLILASR